MWIYYYATYGPGSQSSDYGFRNFRNDTDRETIKDYLETYHAENI